jgi:DNA polymerase V
MSVTINLEIATNNTNELIKYAMKGFNMIYKEDYRFMKCGVIVMDFVPESVLQGSLFSNVHHKWKTVMQAMDKVNKVFGNEVVIMASQGFEKRYKLRAEYLSPNYITNINQIISVKI